MLRKLRELNLPLTRKAYLNLNYWGEPPAEPLDAEQEMELPYPFRTQQAA